MPKNPKHPRGAISLMVKQFRQALGQTQQQFARTVGTAVATVGRWETNRPPSGVWLARLQAAAKNSRMAEFSDKFGDAYLSEVFPDEHEPKRLVGVFKDEHGTVWSMTAPKGDVINIGSVVTSLSAGQNPETVAQHFNEPLESVKALHASIAGNVPTNCKIGNRWPRPIKEAVNEAWVGVLSHLLQSDIPEVQSECLKLLTDIQGCYCNALRLEGSSDVNELTHATSADLFRRAHDRKSGTAPEANGGASPTASE